MGKAAVFTLKLEPELRADFIAEADATHRPASQIVRELMRQFVEQQREARAYKAFVQKQVDLAQEDIRLGRVHTNEEVEAEFAARRAKAVGAA